MITRNQLNIISVIFFLFSVIIFSCRKDKEFPDTNGTLAFSADTLTFDTVFTTIGSTTGFIKVYNPGKKKILISSIRLSGGQNSSFRINVGGTPTNTVVNDIEIAPKDSMYVFVRVTVDPKNQSNPFVILDSVIFETNGSFQDVKLMAWGQYAHFFYQEAICDQTWTKDTPVVIINSCLVDAGCTLTINTGTRIYLHPGSSLLVKGTLTVLGTKTDSVVFQGDRLEHFFEDAPGQWDGIYFFRGSINNNINYAIIKNSTNGIVVGYPTDTVNPYAGKSEIEVHNTIIKNTWGNGISGLYAKIEADNCLIFNCGYYNFICIPGGDYTFTHCTFANFNVTQDHKPVLGLSNYDGKESHDLDAKFINCIIYGGLEEELDTLNKGANFNYSFTNCLVKTKRNFLGATNIVNSDPLFNDISKDDYHLKDGSPAKDKGDVSTAGTKDLNDKTRDGSPDIGCYEYVP